MKKLILFTCLAISAAACNNNAKTEEQEKLERDSSAEVTEVQNQHYVDSMMMAQEALQSDSDSSKTSEDTAPTK
jgi:hypothetical protein